MSTKIYALHGFLGLPSDWDRIGQGIEKPLEALDLFSISHPRYGLQNWGMALNRWVAIQPVEKPILLGYSLGGRLAMHALIDAPQQWAGAILISANPGLSISEERDPRLQIDIDWARRFLHDPWEKLIGDWNRQIVFQGQSLPFPRNEKDYIRTDLSQAIEGWSVGRQDDLRDPLSKLPFPILWIAGEKDLKYAELAKQMAAAHPRSSLWIAPETGHRVPWECPSLFLKEINNSFLGEMRV